MRVLDTTFLIDYDDGVHEAEEFLLDHEDEEFVAPSPVVLEFLLGDVHGSMPTDLRGARGGIEWLTVRSVREETIMHAAQVADEIESEGPRLTAIDAIVAGTARELEAPAVSSGSDLTHDGTKRVLAVEEYR